MNLSTTTDRSGTGSNGAANDREPDSRPRTQTLRPHLQAPTPRGARNWLRATLLILCLAGLPSSAPAQKKTAREAGPANRYLLIVETSRYMKSRGDGALTAIRDLLSSGMSGQLQSGDTLGLWTFNKELSRGEFPLQEWSPAQQQGITDRVLTFLRSQRFENPAKMNTVMPSLQAVVNRSQYITIILVSSGKEDLDGTPFDEPINKLYKTWRSQQEKANMPFVTVLRAQNGMISEYRVGQAPWKPDLPPVPQELLAARAKARQATAAAAAATAAVAKPAPPMLPPLIISGHKQPATPPPVASPTPTPTQPAPPPVQNTVASSSEATSANTAALAVRESPAKSTPQVQAVVPTPDPAPLRPATLVATDTKNELSTKSERAVPAATTAEARPAEPLAPARLARETEATTPAAPPAPAAAASATPQPGNPGPEATTPAASASVPASAGTVVPEPSFFSNKLVWVTAVGGAALLVALLWFWRSRARPEESASLITHSLEQHRP